MSQSQLPVAAPTLRGMFATYILQNNRKGKRKDLTNELKFIA